MSITICLRTRADGLFVEQDKETKAGPFKTASRAWGKAEQLAHALEATGAGVATYTTNPSPVAPFPDDGMGGTSRAAWVITKPRGAPTGNQYARKPVARKTVSLTLTDDDLEFLDAQPKPRGETISNLIQFVTTMKRFHWPSLGVAIIANSRESAIETAVGMSAAQPAHYLTRGETPLSSDEMKRTLEAEEPQVSDYALKSLTI